MTFSQYNATAPSAAARPCEIEFRGTRGTLYVFGNGYEVVPDVVTQNEFLARTPIDRRVERGWRAGAKPLIAPRKGAGQAPTSLHARNFLDCMRSRAQCTCDIEIGHRDTSAAIIGNIAHKLKAHLEWDPKTERFTNHSDANRLLTYEYRAPYRLPG